MGSLQKVCLISGSVDKSVSSAFGCKNCLHLSIPRGSSLKRAVSLHSKRPSSQKGDCPIALEMYVLKQSSKISTNAKSSVTYCKHPLSTKHSASTTLAMKHNVKTVQQTALYCYQLKLTTNSSNSSPPSYKIACIRNAHSKP